MKNKLNLKKITFILSLFTFVCLFLTSCEYGLFDKHKPNRSVLEISFNGEKYSSEGGDFQYSFNTDTAMVHSGYFIFHATHYRDDEIKKYPFTFSSKDVEIKPFGKSGYECAVDLLDLVELGTYRIYCKSSVDSSLDHSFVINVISNLKSLALEYKIQDSYVKDGLEYTSEMLSGTITTFTKELTLVAGAVYDITAKDNNNDEVKIRTIYPTSSSDNIYFRATTDNFTEMVCLPYDNVSSYIKITAGKSDISTGCTIKLKELSSAEVEEVNVSTETEKVLSFMKNSPDNPDKAYNYNVLLNTPTPEQKEILFSIDAEIFDEDAFYDQDYYSPTINPNAHWLSRTRLTYSYDNEEKFYIDTDGTLHTFSVTPVNNTVFRSSTKNLHAYVYVKFKEDKTWRWKWRIMVGGVLEGIQLYTLNIDNNEEELLTSDINIKQGDITGWNFIAKYVPATTENNNTLWYIAKSKSKHLFTDDNGVRFNVPAPAEESSMSNKVLNFMGGKNSTKTIGNFTAYYYLETNAEKGISDLMAGYNSIGESCVLVCMNTDTYIYNCVEIKNFTESTVVVKGINYSGKEKINAPQRYKNTSNVEIETPYKGLSREEQSYPYTILAAYPQYRTFYMDVDSSLEITLESNFKMNQVYVSTGNYDSKNIFTGFPTEITNNGYKSTIDLVTMFYAARPEDKDNILKNHCLSDEAIINVTINNNINFLLRIIVYN